MSSQGNGQPKTFRVTQAGSVKQALTQEYALAKSRGDGAAFIAALEQIYHRLRVNPHSFGEPKYALRGMKATMYSAIQRPLVVGFAIHDTEPIVMIRSIQYLEKP